MRPLRIILTVADAERLRGALVIAAAQVALGTDAALFLQLDAVALLRTPIMAATDAQHRMAGLPDLATLMHEAMALGVTITACQSGMALAGIDATALPEGVEAGGPVQFLSETGDDARLLIG